jgi:hypothetical protein
MLAAYETVPHWWSTGQITLIAFLCVGVMAVGLVTYSVVKTNNWKLIMRRILQFSRYAFKK